jgi:glycine cleavage system H protein
MEFPEELEYTKSHEWVRRRNGGFEVGLTAYAQAELGDLVFVGLPAPGDALKAGAAFAEVESVKAVSQVFSPLTGAVAAVNAALGERPGLINEAPYEAWLIRAEGSLAGPLLNAAEYAALLG